MGNGNGTETHEGNVQAGNVSETEMFRTFNMGVGMIIIVAASDADAVLSAGLGAFRMGQIVKGNGVDLVA
jgi:phosphoribosylformylglycinamidine cyclo-ligase